MKNLIIALSAVMISVMTPVAVYAQTPQISIPVSTIIRGDVGSTHVLAEETIDEDLVNMECSVSATAENQGSVHPGNDIIVSSGDDSVTLSNVERRANGLTEAVGILDLGEKLTVILRLGKDKVFSGGMKVNLQCEERKVIEVCRDGKFITVREDEVLDTDETTCPVEEEKTVKVCRGDKMVEIKESDKKSTDTDSCPKTLSTVTELPKTGASSVIAMVAGSGFIGTIGHAIVTTRRKS